MPSKKKVPLLVSENLYGGVKKRKEKVDYMLIKGALLLSFLNHNGIIS